MASAKRWNSWSKSLATLPRTSKTTLTFMTEFPALATNQLATRADVIAALDRLCDYYARHEPSSPVPLLLHRARGLVDKSFVDLLKDLAPEGLAQLTSVVGAAGMSAPE